MTGWHLNISSLCEITHPFHVLPPSRSLTPTWNSRAYIKQLRAMQEMSSLMAILLKFGQFILHILHFISMLMDDFLLEIWVDLG